MALLVSFGAQAEASPDSPLAWLHRMGKAVRTQAYEGEVVFGTGSHLSIAHIVHRYHDGKVQERLYSLEGSGREIDRDGDKVTSIVPRQHVVFVAEGAGRGLLSSVRRAVRHHLGAYYRLQLDGTGRVAGRPCRDLSAQAKDQYRYDYDFCLDLETALPLRIRIEAHDGRLLEQVMFSRIEFPSSIPDSALKSHVDTSNYKHLPVPGTHQAVASSRVWHITALPPGFQAVVHDRRWLPGVSQPVQHILCTDGLATVSIFVSPLHDGVPAIHGALGAFNAYATVAGSDRITVIGEAPQATLRFIGDRLVAVSPQTSGQSGPRKTSGAGKPEAPPG